MKILCVDDSSVVRKIVSGAVHALGYDALEAGNGQEALALLETESTDVAAITLDVTMPVMSGMECLEALKSNSRFAGIPVVMMTAVADKESVLKAIRMGAKHYLPKPFSPEDVSARLTQVIGVVKINR